MMYHLNLVGWGWVGDQGGGSIWRRDTKRNRREDHRLVTIHLLGGSSSGSSRSLLPGNPQSHQLGTLLDESS
jgi:hypothetical protein